MNIQNIYKLILGLAIVYAIGVAGTLIFNIKNTEASVPIANGYMYKYISSANASSTSYTVVKTTATAGPTILGSIIVGSSTPYVGFPIRIYDGNSTTGTSSATQIGAIKASAVEGTYTFDVNVVKGILLDIPAGFSGSYTVTYR